MQVLLKEDIDNLGYAGEVKKVARGYGRNYLLPRGLAVMATPEAMNMAEAWRSRAEARRAEMRAEYEILSERISGVTLDFVAKAGNNGKLYGSVTNADITDGLNESLGTEIDRRKVDGGPLRQLGEHTITVRLNADFQPQFQVVIRSEDEPVQAIVAEEAVATAEDEIDTDETDETYEDETEFDSAE
ncbi:MAG: 50S ribosomal protein L9 [Anaerolineae bacterium]|nr:50S ribosomal protein L9 [Anaerolineae bacterium]MCO5190015.1 50S ribosomal protein L9 [Anaerolineae bacterium]MCO5196838.1 50S ribosomal protein L9 [Anaerolineae bacterium]MCO5207981.1 50S ribosomal protein L9 [Anaerolineae bacterium]